MSKVGLIFWSGIVCFACCAATSVSAGGLKFHEEDKADVIIRYFSDETCYLMKPKRMEGPFYNMLKKDVVLEEAKQRPGRELAVVVLGAYSTVSEEQAVRQKWNQWLKELNYGRIVFLRAAKTGPQITGLPILENRT